MSEEEENNTDQEELLKLKESIVRELIVMRKAIEADANKLEEHFGEYGDLYYRAEGEMDKKTELILIPLAGQMRLHLKSLLECVTIIDQKLGIKKGKPDTGGEEWDADSYLKSRGRKRKEEE